MIFCDEVREWSEEDLKWLLTKRELPKCIKIWSIEEGFIPMVWPNPPAPPEPEEKP